MRHASKTRCKSRRLKSRHARALAYVRRRRHPRPRVSFLHCVTVGTREFDDLSEINFRKFKISGTFLVITRIIEIILCARKFIIFLTFFKFLYYYLFLYYFIALRDKYFYFLEEYKNFLFEENKDTFFPFYYLRQSYPLWRYFRDLSVALYIYSHYFIPTRKAYALAVSSCRWIGT